MNDTERLEAIAKHHLEDISQEANGEWSVYFCIDGSRIRVITSSMRESIDSAIDMIKTGKMRSFTRVEGEPFH